MRTLKGFYSKRKRVLVRCDFNIPLDKQGNVFNNFKIKQTLPTIKYLIKQKAKVILISHLGRPKNREIRYNSKSAERSLHRFASSKKLKLLFTPWSLKPVAQRLEKLLNRKVRFINDCIGDKVKKEIENMGEGEILLLENLRFYKEEENNDENFAKKLASLTDFYINDAFSVSHRAHASVVGVTKFLLPRAGLLLEKEIKTLEKVIKKPKLPLVAIFGGREGNFKAINKISEKADFILINWLIEKEIMENNIHLRYPKKIIKPIDGLRDNLDIGEKTISLFKERIFQAKTIFWSGPLGLVEENEFSKGTKEIAKAIADSKAFSVAGGGETIEVINKLRLNLKFSYLSTGGNAMLEFLSREELPGIKALG